MRITVLCTDLGIRLPGEKGASMHLASITRALVAIGHEVQLIGVAGHGDAPVHGLAECHLLPHPGRATGVQRERNKLEFVAHVARTMLEPVQRFAPHVVYERLSLFGDAGIALTDAVSDAVHLTEVNALLAEEEAIWRGLHHSSLARRIEHEVLSRTHAAVAVSAEVRDAVRGTAPGARVHLVENGAEVHRFEHLPGRDAARARLGLPSAAPMACFVGALRPWHGVELAIEAVARTADVHLMVVGDGEVRPELEHTAAALGVSARVHFLGHRPPDDVPWCLAAADVALAPYPGSDTFSFSPLKVYEYLASGTPVVASAIGQIPAALGDGEFGTLVPAGDIAALAAALTTVPADPAARERAAAGRAHALAYHGWDDRARRITALATECREQRHALA